MTRNSSGAAAEPGLSKDSSPVRSSELAWRSIDGEVVVIDLRRRVVRGFNQLGSEVWNLVDGTRTVDAIASSIAYRFAEDKRSSVISDVWGFLEGLLGKGLIH